MIKNMGVPTTLDVEQMYAIKRIADIAKTHLNEKYIDPRKCELITRINDLCDIYMKGK